MSISKSKVEQIVYFIASVTAKIFPCSSKAEPSLVRNSGIEQSLTSDLNVQVKYSVFVGIM